MTAFAFLARLVAASICFCRLFGLADFDPEMALAPLLVLSLVSILEYRYELAAAQSRIRDLELLADTLQTGIAMGGRRGGKV